MNSMKCPHCVSGTMQELLYEKAVQAGRRKVSVAGLKRFACDNCAGELVSRAQMRENNSLIAQATDRESVGLVDAAMLKGMREKFDLTQKDASFLFGAGESSFAKWESGQSAMSTPAALLVHCAVNVPGVVEHLASVRGFKLPCTRANEWSATLSSGHSLNWELASSVISEEFVHRGKVNQVRSCMAIDVATVIFSHARHGALQGSMHGLYLKLADGSSLDESIEWTAANPTVRYDANQPSTTTRFND